MPIHDNCDPGAACANTTRRAELTDHTHHIAGRGSASRPFVLAAQPSGCGRCVLTPITDGPLTGTHGPLRGATFATPATHLTRNIDKPFHIRRYGASAALKG
jgi:hypothetical protein